MNRRSLLSMLAATPLGWFLSGSGCGSKGKVEVMEHVPETKYEQKWEFATEAEAIEFVQSLTPKLTKVWLPVGRQTDITQLHCVIVSRKEPEKIQVAGWRWINPEGEEARMPFWSISNAWSYLANIRVNGKPVSRFSKGSNLTSYFTEPFLKGKPEVIGVSKKWLTIGGKEA